MLPDGAWARISGYAEGEGPVLAPIRDTAGFASLAIPDRVAEVTAPIMQAVTRIRAELPPDKSP